MATCSPLREDSAGFKDAIDESCWTPFQLPRRLPSPGRAVPILINLQEYILSKAGVGAGDSVLQRRGEACARSRWSRCPDPSSPCALQGHTTESLECAASPVTRNARRLGRSGHSGLLQRLMGSVPLVHVDDVWDALVFCMERPSMAGLFLCAATYLTPQCV
nr:unnamed protein product [Digitaria exilis]